MKTIYINQQPIELYKILKFENLVYGGGEAKMAITQGYVMLNHEVETQKRKKVMAGDIIEFDQQQYRVELSEPSKPTDDSNKNRTDEQAAVKTKPKRTAIKF